MANYLSTHRTKDDAIREARNVVNAWTAGAAIVGWVPGSMLVLSAMDAKVVHDVAHAFDVKSYTIQGVAAAVSASVTGKIIAGELLSFFPGIGWALKSVVAGAVTKGLGEALIAYFAERSQLV